ncbi:MAG: DNRLRE domain-containing protein [Chloroflexi bacterium]|nr:MAG: DNRLRE domain-containing protein [Chloroflexota bacterium]
MSQMSRLRHYGAFLAALLMLAGAQSVRGQGTTLFLPIVQGPSCGGARSPRINIPGFGNAAIPFAQTAIAWFGQLSPDSNYADIRAGYNNAQLYVYFAVFDRHLWHDTAPAPGTLTQWDAVTLLIDTAGGSVLSASSWRFVAQLSGDPDPAYRAAYRGNGSGWQAVSASFQAVPGWRGNALNDNSDTDRGWAMGFTIPFSSLGLSGPPALGTQWRIAAILHDRDAQVGPPLADQRWPSAMAPDTPQCWGWLRFGLPAYATIGTPSGYALIRRPTQTSPLVPDADVGGTSSNQCPGNDAYIWPQWANANYGSAPDFNIQNQSDVADWPCFSKYFITFPLTAIPPGKTILSATLTLYQFGNSGGASAPSSWIQVLLVNGAWQEHTLTWNNAPPFEENVGGAWVPPIINFPGWPGVPRVWNVSYAVATAYARGEPLRLALYSADSDYHTGKYFVSSDTGDWNTAGRPRLEVWWRD